MITKNKTVLWSAGTVAILLFFINRIFFFNAGYLEKAATTITYPFVAASSSLASYVSNIIVQKRSYQELQEHANKLALENEIFQEQLIKLQATARHYNQSKELIDFQNRYNLSNALVSKILVKNLSDDEHYYLINQGSRDGVVNDMVAIYKLQIIGKVVEVWPCYSKVMLLTDQQCKIAAFTNTTDAQGIVQGTNKNNHCTLSYITSLSTINLDDLVFCSGQGLIFPEGFCLGKISKHRHQPNALYHEIDIEPLVDLSTINFCLLTNQSKINLF
ncbi:rod shape-determining protein MreC [Candidatus Babeliales bacterium]|nr:rod shape-determining protein MreC [Candidatus Babeliales bacterium]